MRPCASNAVPIALTIVVRGELGLGQLWLRMVSDELRHSKTQMLSCRTLYSLDLLASTIVIHQQLWTLRHLEDALVEVTQDSYGRLPQNMRQSDIQIKKAQST